MSETLSEKRICAQLFNNSFGYGEEDVKEKTNDFLKELREEIKTLEVKTANETGIMNINDVLIDGEIIREKIIDKLSLKHFGDKLLEKKHV